MTSAATGDRSLSGGRPLALAGAFGAIYLIWGSNYLAIKVLVASLPPLLVAGMRSATAGAILFAWARARGVPAPTHREWRDGTVAGALMFLCGHGALFWASRRVASGVASLLVATIPLWVALFSTMGGGKLTAASAAGLVLGLIGIAWLHLPSVGAGVDVWVSTVLLAGSAAWGAGMLWHRGDRRPRSTAMAASLPLLAGGALLLGVSVLAEFPVQDARAVYAPAVMACFAYLVIGGSVVTFSAFAWLVDTVSPTAVASYAFVNPIVALGLGWTLGHEPFVPAAVWPVGAVLAAVGLIIIGEGDVRAGRCQS